MSIVYNDTDDQWTFGTETVEAGHILPAAHETYDLGSTTSAWKDLYLSGTSIYLGDLQITSTASGALEIDNGTKLGGEEETQTLTTTNVTVVRKDIVMAAPLQTLQQLKFSQMTVLALLTLLVAQT